MINGMRLTLPINALNGPARGRTLEPVTTASRKLPAHASKLETNAHEFQRNDGQSAC